MVPAALDSAYLMVGAEPIKAVQVEPDAVLTYSGVRAVQRLQFSSIKELQFFLG